MLARDLESRERSKRARLLRQAGFPVPKAVEGFDWSNVRFPEGWGRDEMLSLDFVGRAEDLVFHGPTVRGKTRVATALGIEVTRRGVPARFFQTATLVPQLGKAKREGTLDRLLADVGRAELVILDEFGYVPFDVDGARLLYQVISDSYERRSIVLATNVESGRWGTVFADDKLAAAIVDRVSTTAGSSSSAAQATVSRSRSCWASQDASGAPVTEPEKVACPNPKVFRDHFRKRDLTKHIVAQRGVLVAPASGAAATATGACTPSCAAAARGSPRRWSAA